MNNVPFKGTKTAFGNCPLFKCNSIHFHWWHRNCSTKKKKKKNMKQLTFIIRKCKHRKTSQVIKRPISALHIPELNILCNYSLYYSRQVPSPSTIKAVSRNSWSILEKVLSMGKKLFVRLHYFCF